MAPPKQQNKQDYTIGRFQAMAGPCEILIDSQDTLLGNRLTAIARQEALRIEHKLSRYRTDNIIHTINTACGGPVEVDDETAQMLDYAAQCFELSEGLFDITSGVLREIWHFDGSDNIPTQSLIEALLPRIGWQKLDWQRPVLRMPQGMQIDLGGIGKEYAVDRTLLLLQQETPVSCLINYGGDIAASGPRHTGKGWMVGIEIPDLAATDTPVQGKVCELKQGAMATSGDARRYLLKDGVRYSHILDPLTGWPVDDAPRSVTVIADTCTEAGILATLAMLQGSKAEDFLEQQGVQHWCFRD